MGFFTQLGDLWAPNSKNYGFGKSWDLLGDAWGKTTDSVKAFASGVWGLATSPFDDKRSVVDSFMDLNFKAGDASRGIGGAGLDLLGSVGELPVLKQALGTAGWVQNELVKRPLGAGYLMTGDVALGKASYFDTDAWKQAYNDTRYVTTGQAATYSMYASGGVSGAEHFDPRAEGMQDAYRNNTMLKYQSGAIDAAADIFADPTVYGGKAATALKLKYISKPLRTAADVDKYMTGPKYTKLRDFIKAAPSPEAVRQQAFNAHRGGDKAAALLWDVRNEDDLYKATFNALYGSEEDWEYLVQHAPRIAQATGRVYANQTIATASNLAGQSAKADAVVSSLRETESQAFVDAIANGQGAWGAAKGVLVAQSAPRLTVTSKWRAGVHNWATFGPAVFRGTAIYPVASRARYALPSAKFTRFMDVNDVNSVGAFRSNLERAPFTREQLEGFVSQYGRASSPEARSRIAASAEDAGFKLLAERHGFTPEHVEQALPAINRWRIGNRKVFSTSRRYLSKDVIDLYNKYVGVGREAEADNSYFLGRDMDAAVARGDQPSGHFHMLDEDGNNVLIPGRFDVDPAKPVALSQTAEIMAMMDWRVLDTALAWEKLGPVGSKAYTVINAGGTLLDMVNRLWKTTALVRPGYAWRMLSDDVMRRGTLYGAARVMMSSSRGVKNAATNFHARGGLVRDYWSGRRRAGGLDSVDTIDGEVVDSGARLTDISRQPLGGPYEPDPDALAMSAGKDVKLRNAIEITAGRNGFTKADLRRELGVGDQTANRLLDEMHSRGLVEIESEKGRVTYRRSRVDPQDIGLLDQPLKYNTYDRALADGVLSVDDYISKVAEHAARGDLPGDLAMIHQGYREGVLAPAAQLERDYRRDVTKLALRSVGRGAYTYPNWQQSFVDAVVKRHRSKAQGKTGVATVVDPMTGTSPKFDVAIQPHDFTLSNGESVAPAADEVYRYVDKHLNDLLKPRNVLHTYVAPDGRLHLSVARWDGEATTAVKPTGGVRVTLGKAEGREKAMSGADRVVVNTPSGQVGFDAAFEGAEGSRFMAQTSSRGPQGAWADQVADTDYARLINASHTQKDVGPTEPHYGESWQRAVNVQLHGDQAARMFMNGKSVDDVLNWMRNTADGRAYWGRLGPWQSRPVEQVYAVKAMVDTYLPLPGDAAARHEVAAINKGGAKADVHADAIVSGGDAHTAALDLRKAALEGKASFNQFDKLFPNKEDMPAVHGASLDVTVGGPFTNAVKRGVDNTFKVLSDMPADRASRFPFFAERYQDHLRDLAPMYAERAGGAQFIKTDAIHKIQQDARSRALADVKKYLYDTSAALDMASAGRLFVPFASAVGDSFLKWGVIAREKGVIPPVLNIWKLWTAPDRAGLVQDEDGNVKKWDSKTRDYVWYQRNPKTGEEVRLDGHEPKQEYIVFQLPAAVDSAVNTTAKIVTFGQKSPTSRLPDGTIMPSYINKETFNTFLGLPTAGPLVAVPANEFELKNPKLADNWFMRKFVTPFGPTSDIYKAALPSNVRSTYFAATGNEQNRRGIAQAVMQTEYTKYALGMRDKPPTMEEVQQAAGDISGLQWTSQFLGVSTQFKSPYQPYVDYYRMLQQTDPEHATARFYNDMGDEFRMMTASVSRNVAGLPASIATAKTQAKYADLIAKFPDLAPLIVGAEGAGSFNSAVYQAQLEQSLQPGSDRKMREVLSLQESVEDAERRYVWTKYSKLMDAVDADMVQRGLTSLNQKRAADLKAIKDKFIEDNKYWTNPQGVHDVNPWFAEFSTTNRATMTQRLTAMVQLVTDDRIGGRDDMQGLYDYLRARTQVRQEMQQRGFATLTAKKAGSLSVRWDAYVTGLKEQNLAFADLYNRWLTNDDMTADYLNEGGE